LDRGLDCLADLSFLFSTLRTQIPELGGRLLHFHLLGLGYRLEFDVIHFRQGGQRGHIRDIGDIVYLGRIVRDVLNDRGLLNQGPGWTCRWIGAPGGVEPTHVARPVWIGPVLPLIVAERGISDSSITVIGPGHEAQPSIARIVVIPEVIVVRPDEQR
jgi:hypothetical protein